MTTSSFHRRTLPTTMVLLVLALVLALSGSVLAQSARVLGTIEGTLGGEPRTWYALDLAGPDGSDPTASVTDFGFGLLSISIVAKPEQRFMVEGAISIDITVMGALDCPCVFDDAEIVYWSSSSMFSDVYLSDEPGMARVTITRWEQVADGVFALEGEVEAELVYHEGVFAEADESRTLRLEASISIGEVPEETF